MYKWGLYENKKLFLLLLILAGTIAQNIEAASASYTSESIASLNYLKINVSSRDIQINEFPVGELNGIIYFDVPHGSLSTQNAKITLGGVRGIPLIHEDGYSNFTPPCEDAPQAGMICYKQEYGFGIILTLNQIRASAEEDCPCGWLNLETVYQSIARLEPEMISPEEPGLPGETLVFLFGDPKEHWAFVPFTAE